MKLKWIELKPYYTYKTCYPKTELIVSFDNNETQNMEYTSIDEKIRRYKEVIREGKINIFYVLKYWRYFRPNDCIIKAIEDKFKCSVYKLLK